MQTEKGKKDHSLSWGMQPFQVRICDEQLGSLSILWVPAHSFVMQIKECQKDKCFSTPGPQIRIKTFSLFCADMEKGRGCLILGFIKSLWCYSAMQRLLIFLLKENTSYISEHQSSSDLLQSSPKDNPAWKRGTSTWDILDKNSRFDQIQAPLNCLLN